MHVGVLGGTGNISTEIVSLLLKEGHQVSCINRSGTAPEGAAGVVGNRDEEESLKHIVNGLGLDAAIHMLCYNADHAESALRVFAEIPHLVHCSTGSTYGCPWPAFPVTEKTPFTPQGDYGVNKHLADEVFMNAHRSTGLPVTILKPNTTYGSTWRRFVMGQLPGSMLYRMAQGKPVVLVNEGEALHHFLSASDCAKAFVFCLQRTSCFGQVYNCSSTTPHTWRQWCESIMEITGFRVPIIGVSRADIRKVLPDLRDNAMWYHMVTSSNKLIENVPEFTEQQTLKEGLAAAFSGWNSSEVEHHREQVDILLDDLVGRSMKFSA